MSVQHLGASSYARLCTMMWLLADGVDGAHGRAQQKRVRTNHIAPLLIAIPIAAVLLMGLAAAWFIYCQRKGLYPALDMPSFKSGGTWKAYCAR